MEDDLCSGIEHNLKELSTQFLELTLKQRQHDAAVADLKTQLGSVLAQLDMEERASDSIRDELETKSEQWQRERMDLESQIVALKGYERRIVCLIDGDGSIFHPELLAEGQIGGQTAGQELTRHIHKYMSNYHSSSSLTLELSIYVFLHKKGLLNALDRAGYSIQATTFDDFLAGFNQSGQRFMMVDVGAGKENADSKLKVFLQDHAHSYQTTKIFLGASHDNGYVPVLRSLISDGLRDKLVLLPGYTEIARDIRSLELPTLLIPDLFMSERLCTLRSSHSKSPSISSIPCSIPSSSVPSASLSDAYLPLSPIMAPVAPHTPQSPQKNFAQFSIPDGMRPRDPKLALKIHRPPPCPQHYLRNACPLGVKCIFGHHWLLEQQDLVELAALAKGLPCRMILNRGVCLLNNMCINSHKCPNGRNCPRLKEHKCIFPLEMHD